MERTILSMMLGIKVIGSLILICLIVLPISYLLLILYRRSLRRSMKSEETQKIDPGFFDSITESQGRSSINKGRTIKDLQSDHGLIQSANRQRRVAAMLYALAGVVQGAAMTLLMFGNPVYFHIQLSLWPTLIVLLWPSVLTVVWVLGWSTFKKIATVVTYLVLTIGAGKVFGVVFPSFLEIYLIAPLIITIAITNRTLRPVAPWLFVAIFPVVFSSSLFPLSLTEPTDIGLLAVSIGFGLIYVPIVAGIYRKKWASDQALVLNSLWLTFVLFESLNLIILSHVLESSWGPALGLATYFIFRAILAVGMRVLRRSTRATRGTRLLVLRTFVTKGKNARLISSIIEKWRYMGCINLIAAPDLASDHLEPHKLMDFLLRRTDSKFIGNGRELRQAFETVDTKPDLDARYRVNEFFCRDTT